MVDVDVEAGAGSATPAGMWRARAAAGARRLAARVAREPLFHFFLVGAVLFVLAEHHRAQTDIYRIVVTPDEVAKLQTDYRMQFGADPSPAATRRLVDKYIDEEVLYREGLALKLDRDDEIVRRRVVQKMQFLQQDLSAPAEPTEAEMEQYYRGHLARYATPEKVTFSHIYFSPDRGGDAAARRRAEVALAGLNNAVTRAPERGDNFPDLYDYADFGPEQALRLFGDTDLARMLFQVPVGRWAGPFRSGYGWHLVYVQSQAPAHVPPFAEVRDQVRADVIAADQAAANRKAFQTLKARFTVVRQDEARP